MQEPDSLPAETCANIEIPLQFEDPPKPVTYKQQIATKKSKYESPYKTSMSPKKVRKGGQSSMSFNKTVEPPKPKLRVVTPLSTKSK